MADQNGASRLDRIERALELLIDDHVQFREEHKLLLTAQVVLTDRLDKLTQRVDKLAESVDKLGALGAHTDERLNALITIVDGMIRKQQ
jgi:hypothetical protein